MSHDRSEHSLTGVHADSRSSMWRVLSLAIVVASALLISACEQEQDRPDEPPAIHYRDSTIVMRNEGCTGSDDECCVVELTIPVYSGGKDGASDSLNRRVRGFFVSLLGSNVKVDSTMPDIIEAGRNLMEEFEDFRSDFPMSTVGWEVRGGAEVLANDSIICTKMEAYNYLGGAHGFWIVEFDVARVASGDTLAVLDLVSDRAAFLRAAEKGFRSAVGMAPNDSDYGSQGYWFKDNEFRFPENIGLSKDSVIFHYNVYEIAPYSMGSVRFSLPRTLVQ